MQWDRNDGRYTCVLPGDVVVHAAKIEGGWELLVPAADIHEVIRNPKLKTWLTARSVVERTLRAKLVPGGLQHHRRPGLKSSP